MEINKDTPKEDRGEYEMNIGEMSDIRESVLAALGVWRGELE